MIKICLLTCVHFQCIFGACSQMYLFWAVKTSVTVNRWHWSLFPDTFSGSVRFCDKEFNIYQLKIGSMGPFSHREERLQGVPNITTYRCFPGVNCWQDMKRELKKKHFALAQVMACCLTAPSHYLNQCWRIITEAKWCSSEGNFAWDITAIGH